MGEFDPFSGGSNFSSYEYKPKSKPNNLQPRIIKGIIIFVVLAVIGIGVYYLFFNTVEIEFSVNNTEGEDIDSAQIEINFGNRKRVFVAPEEIIKLKKNGEYTANVSAKDYSPQRNIEIDTSGDNTNTIILEKNIALIIKNITCPQKVFLGQTIVCQINVENQNLNENYDINSLVFEGDIKNWDSIKNKTYKFVDTYDEELSQDRRIVRSRTNAAILVSFSVPNDKKLLGKKEVAVRVNYRREKKQASIEILESPNITFSSEITALTRMISGEEKRVRYIIDNTKNTSAISNLTLDVDANYLSDFNYNLDLSNTILKDRTNITVEAKLRHEGQITIDLSSTVRAGKIEGNLILIGSIFPEPKKIPFSINIDEPENKFLLSLNKNTETLTYDANTKTTNEKIIYIKIDNQNNIKSKINALSVENVMDDNCENWIAVSDLYNNYEIQPKAKLDIPIVLKGMDLTELLEITGTKLCAINVNYQNPFTMENNDKILNLTINVG